MALHVSQKPHLNYTRHATSFWGVFLGCNVILGAQLHSKKFKPEIYMLLVSQASETLRSERDAMKRIGTL